MPGSPDCMDSGCNWDAIGASYQVMYLVKRPSYEFVYAIPTGHPIFRSVERAFFHVRFKDRPQTGSFVLNLEELEDFYDGLRQLVEYIRTECEKRGGSFGPG
jgi:hypothetical protein